MPRVRPYFVLVVLWGLYFHPLLVRPAGTLFSADSDFLAEHLPAKIFLNREWRETGELPLWNPYHFCGTPFVHDIQVGCFYPPYAVTYLVPEAAVGAALSWVIALHVLAAGVFAYVYARAHDLGELGSLVAATGFMLSAKWMTHLLLAGHTVTVGLAWLPVVLLGLERGTRTGELRPVIGAGVGLALLVLGIHPQWTFYAGVFAALWTIPLERAWRPLARWLVCGLGVVLFAVLLSAVQLLPTLEASRLSARTGGVEASGAFSLALPTFLGLVGPSLTGDVPRAWEVRGIFGACWLAAALAAPALAGGQARWQLGVLVGLIFFSVGGAVLVEWLPGFSLFRVPGRMLLIASFPLAYLAGVTTDALVRAGWDAASARVVRRNLALVVVLLMLPAGLAAFWEWRTGSAEFPWSPGVLGWVGILAAVALGVLLGRPLFGAPGMVWTLALLIELLGPTLLIPEVRPQSEIIRGSEGVDFLAEHTRPGEARVLDFDTAGTSLLGVGAPVAMTHRIETIRGYNPLDVRHYREFLGFVIDDPGPLRGNSPLTQQVIPNFEVANRELLNVMNVRYLVRPENEPPPDQPAQPRLAIPMKGGRGMGVLLYPQIIYENPAAFPRVFVVPTAAPMPAGRELDALKECDFRRVVLLTTPGLPDSRGTGAFRLARVAEYRPNRVRVEFDGGPGGFLVLSDVWFPGWTCRVDGVDVAVERANHAFRAVAIPPGAREAVFSFEPRSYRIGWWVSAASACAVLTAVLIRLGLGRLARRSRFGMPSPRTV